MDGGEGIDRKIRERVAKHNWSIWPTINFSPRPACKAVHFWCSHRSKPFSFHRVTVLIRASFSLLAPRRGGGGEPVFGAEISREVSSARAWNSACYGRHSLNSCQELFLHTKRRPSSPVNVTCAAHTREGEARWGASGWRKGEHISGSFLEYSVFSFCVIRNCF